MRGQAVVRALRSEYVCNINGRTLEDAARGEMLKETAAMESMIALL